MADSFIGGVHPKGDKRGDLRARVALVGANVEALTGSETFRIPLVRCEVASEREKIVVRDLERTLEIWTDEPQFLDALERTRHGAVKLQVDRIRRAMRRRRAVEWFVKALVVNVVIFAVGIPMTRWAVRGGISAIPDAIGQSALEQLHLPTGQAAPVERQLDKIAEQLQPVSLLGRHSLRILLADYGDVHTFHMPPNVVIVTSALVCNADEPSLVTAAIALELAHLEARDVTAQMKPLVDWQTSLDVLSGDTKKLRDFMLDYADSRRAPGYTEAQEAAAVERASTILKEIAVPLEAGQDIATLLARVKELRPKAADAGVVQVDDGKDESSTEWGKIQAEACHVVGQ